MGHKSSSKHPMGNRVFKIKNGAHSRCNDVQGKLHYHCPECKEYSNKAPTRVIQHRLIHHNVEPEGFTIYK